ncbi:MAG TPA: hypothetical protein PLG94_11145 [Smithellaceae bacterium]|nr:hypothetical protein [Smithellaceae bacterium]
MNPYNIAAIVYGVLAILTVIPAMWPVVFGQQLHASGPWVNTAIEFNDLQKKKLQDHYERLRGTLGFWKSRAAGYRRFHYYCIYWTILSSWAVPLISATASPVIESKWLLTVISSHVALALSFYRGLGAHDKMKLFRHGESEYYDLTRTLLDTPSDLGTTTDEQLENYFKKAAQIRQYVRHAETESLFSVDEVRHRLSEPTTASDRDKTSGY